MDINLEKRVALVIGGNGLIGREVCTALRTEGAKVISADIKNPDEITHLDADYYTIRLNFLSEEDVENVIKEIEEKIGCIDILINSAYPRNDQYMQDFLESDYASWCDNVAMNINGCFLITQRVARRMVKNKIKGSIINFGSIYGVVGPDFRLYEGTLMNNPSAYSLIKGGIISFSRYLAVYLAPYGIRVNTISPGGVYENQPKPFVDAYCKKVPAGRMASPKDISGAVVFLASDMSNYITGHNLVVDGGWTIV